MHSVIPAHAEREKEAMGLRIRRWIQPLCWLIALLTLPVLVQVLLARMGVVIAGTAAEVLGLSREKELLGETAGLLGFLAAVCVIAALMFVYALTLFAKTAAAMGA